MIDVNKIRKDFPILNKKVNGQNLIYFDNAATSQKPSKVINSISEYYFNYNANITTTKTINSLPIITHNK